MSKRAIYYDEAQRLYVNQGMTLDAIEGILEEKITRRTLFNWKEEGNWDSKRERYLAETADLDELMRQVAKTALTRAAADPSPKNVLAMARAVAALKAHQGLSLLDDPEPEVQTSAEQKRADIVEMVRKALEG